LGEAHRRYTRRINFREGWRGHLWQERFFSCVLDGPHALAAARYVERNPVRAGLVEWAWDWPWSSAAAHVSGRGDLLVRPGGPLVAEVARWREFLQTEEDEQTLARLRRHARTGRPLGGPALLDRLESLLGRTLRPRKPGPKPQGANR
jgi:putative transposase